jgi:hypothetical protein
MRHPSRRASWLGPLAVLALLGLSATGARAQSLGRSSAPYHGPSADVATATAATATATAIPSVAQPATSRAPAAYYFPPATFARPTTPATTSPAATGARRSTGRLRPLSDEYGPKNDYHYKS